MRASEYYLLQIYTNKKKKRCLFEMTFESAKNAIQESKLFEDDGLYTTIVPLTTAPLFGFSSAEWESEKITNRIAY